MEENRLKLHKNLKLMYYANGLMAIGILLVIVPVAGLIMMAIGGVMELGGLVRLRNVHHRYMDAVSFSAIGFLIGIIPTGEGLFAICLGVIGSVMGLLRFRCVIQATNHFLAEERQEELVTKGNKLWKYQIILTVASVVCELLGAVFFDHMIPVLVILLVTLVLSAVTLGIYIDYLEKSSKVFEQ